MTMYRMDVRRHFQLALSQYTEMIAENDAGEDTASADTSSEHPAWCHSMWARCQANDPKGAVAIVREQVEPQNDIYEVTVNILRFVRGWDASRGLLDVDEVSLRRGAKAQYPDVIDEWACVRFLVDTHRERRAALRFVSFPELPEKVQAMARGRVWDAVNRAIVVRYSWLEDPVAELEAQRLLGYAGTPMEFFERSMEFWAKRLSSQVQA